MGGAKFVTGIVRRAGIADVEKVGETVTILSWGVGPFIDGKGRHNFCLAKIASSRYNLSLAFIL